MVNHRKRSAPGSSQRKRSTTTSTSSTSKEQQGGNNKQKKKKSTTSIFGKWVPSPHLKYSIVILIIAMLMSLWWNSSYPTDPHVLAFWKQACSTTTTTTAGGGRATCSNGVVPTRRTLHSVRPVRAGERLVEIPRSLQIWDLDALRNEFVQEEKLLTARHGRTGNPLGSGAFLAVYLALLQQQQQQTSDDNSNTTTTSTAFPSSNNVDSSSMLQSYLQLLPTTKDLEKLHPLFWEDKYLTSWVGGHSMSFSIVRAYRDMIESEYDAFRRVSPTFTSTISKRRYLTARVNVLSRSFSPGKGIGELIHDNDVTNFASWEEELQSYRKQMGRPDYMVDGCHAMVPFLDLLNHHPNPNVLYSYDTNRQAFVITAKTPIPGSWEFMDSYGRFTDPHLFAKFGFLNGDGSGSTQATIALFHRVLDLLPHSEFSYLPFEFMEKKELETDNPKQLDVIRSVQRTGLIKYLNYDDGYQECIQGPDIHPNEFRLKQLKLQHLERIANDARSWIVHMGPRSTKSFPLERSDIAITLEAPEFDPRKLKVDIAPIVATCRLMSLIVDDYDGHAIELLEENLDNPDFQVEPTHQGEDALEYRSLMCLARLTSTSLMQFGASVKDELVRVQEVNRNEFQSINWTMSHLRLSEMQTLNSIAGISFAHIKKWERELEHPTGPEFTIRDKSCPPEFSELLLPPEKAVEMES